MRCTKCGQELPESAAFCPNCGERAGGGNPDADKPIYLSEVKGWLKSGRLAVYRDRVEFSASSAQKTVFNYASLVSVKKRLLPTPAILFITEDARTEACAATSKNIHEAFLHVEQAVKPYLEERKARLLAQGIRYSLVSSMGMTNSGILNITDDRAEFTAKSGKREIISFQDVKAASLAAGALELSLFDGGSRSFALEKESRDEVLAFVKTSLAPFLARRKEELLSRGIYFSFLSVQGQETGTLDIYEDRAEFTARSGRTELAAFRDVRTAGLYGEALELHLVDGTAKAFTVDRDEQDEVLAFVKGAIEPYVRKRTEGFNAAFGSAERIEFNRERGVFHLIRQNGAVITEECPLEAITACRQEESTALNAMISGIRMGGKAIANKAAEMAGRQGAAEEEEKIRSIDVALTVRAGEDRRTETLRFGDFPLGTSRTSPKYAQCAAEAAGLMDFLREVLPQCELILPPPPEPEKALPAGPEDQSPSERPAEAAPSPEREEDLLGIQKYIDRISQYIGACQTPMTIAFQGSAEGGENSMMKLLSGSLGERYGDNRIWLHTKQLSRSDLGEKLPMFLGAALVSQLGGTNDGRVVKFAKAFINLSVSMISQGNANGQLLIDAFFKDNPANSVDDLVRTFSELVKKKSGGGKGKVIVFVDGLDSLAPAKMVDVLEAMEDFFDCEDCVFVVAVDYASVLRGVNERYGQDEERGKSFFNKIFRISFRLPTSGFQIEGYVKSRLERMGLSADEEEVKLCCGLLARSTGGRPEDVDHLFSSFELLKTLADEDLYQRRESRLALFGLLCMQAGFPQVYGQLARMRDAVTPELLSGLCGPEPEAVLRSGLTGERLADFREFAQVFCGVIDTDGVEGISRQECGMFVQALEFTSIISR